jgi:hypothetical protein
VLESVLFQNPKLKEAIQNGKLLCFADDILLIADSKEEAGTLIQEVEGLRHQHLALNKQKTQILSDIKDVEEIEGIPVSKKIKYLGVDISTNR